MNPKVTDVQVTLRYGREKIGLRLLAIGVVGLFLGLAIVLYGDSRDLRLPGWVALILGAALTAYEFYKTANPGKPPLELSPRGIVFRIEMLKEIFIPWHEVRGVDAVEITDQTRRGALWPVKFPNVTVVLVSRRFYERAIHTDSILRGPGWENTFVPAGDMVQVALHHVLLPVKPEQLRAAVEARWLAFRDTTGAERPSGEAA
jgi:hypothetical protein